MIRLTREQVREIDRRSVEEYHIPGIVLMENAARAVATAAIDMMAGQTNVSCWIVCGGGNNGGDGLATARHLHNAGWNVEIIIASEKPYVGDAAINFEIVQQMAIKRRTVAEIQREWNIANYLAMHTNDLLIDALFGTGLTQKPKQAGIICGMNDYGSPILSVDIPSGLDCDTGEPLGVHPVQAQRTVTFVAEKAGFANPKSKRFTGEVTVADIGCPRELIEHFSHRPDTMHPQ